MPSDIFDFTVLRWKLPLMHARQLDDVAYEKIIDKDDDYGEFITACQVVYRGAARTAEVTRYLVLLVMFSRTALEPVDGRKAKMEALFRWATGEAPTTKGKAGRLGAALRVSHFLFCHGRYMDAFVLHRYFSLNSVIDCPKTLLVDDRLLTRLLEQLCKTRHSTAEVSKLAHRILQGDDDEEEEDDEEKHQHAGSPRAAQPATPRLRSIKAVKEDGTYLVELSNRSRCASLTKEAVISTEGGKAMFTAFLNTLGAGTALQSRSSRKEHAVLEICGRRGKQHRALLEGNTCRRWYPTTQLLLWKDGKAKVEEYDALHPPIARAPAIFVAKEQAYYIDQMSKEPLTDPYTLEAGGHRESYNLSSWQSLMGARRTYSPVLKAPIEFYQPDGLAVFLPQPDPALKAEVALWLLTPEGQAYSAEVDIPIPTVVHNSADAESISLRMEVEDARAERKDAVVTGQSGSSDAMGHGDHQLHSHEPVHEEADASTSGQGSPRGSINREVEVNVTVLPAGLSGELDNQHYQVCDSEASDTATAATNSTTTIPSSDELFCSRAEVEMLRAQLKRVKQQLLASTTTISTSSARRRPQVRSTLPIVERVSLIKELCCAQKVDEATDFLTDNVIAYFMEVLNHHNHLLQHQDQHAYCFDPQVVARAAAGDGYGLRAFDPIAADAARYWLLPRNTPQWHWWLDVYDRFHHVLYRADSAAMPHSSDSLRLSLWPESPPEIRNLSVSQQKDGVSCGDHVIQFTIVIACPGWYPDSGTLSRVRPWDRNEMLSQLDAGSWEIQRPQPRLAPELIDARKESEKPQRSWDAATALAFRETLPSETDLDTRTTESDSESLPDQPSPSASSVVSLTSPASSTTPTFMHSTPDRANKRARLSTASELEGSGESTRFSKLTEEERTCGGSDFQPRHAGAASGPASHR
jgi:hypothetical protein